MEAISTFESLVDSEEVRRVRASLEQNGYAHTNEVALGLPGDLHKDIEKRFFTENLLGIDAAR